MYNRIGFIGAGNMASAMIGGIIRSGIFAPEKILVSDIKQENVEQLIKKYNIEAAPNNCELTRNAQVIILAVKPQIYGKVIAEVTEFVDTNTLIISIAAGLSIEDVKRLFGKDLKVIRAMPNTPALVGAGMTGLAASASVRRDELEFARKLFASFGLVELVDEDLLEAVTAVSGSSPAFILMLIEAMADGAVLLGLSREQAYTMAAQAVKGSAQLVLETGSHPGVLKDQVCSPGGATIVGVRTLESLSFKSAMIEAMLATATKADQLRHS